MLKIVALKLVLAGVITASAAAANQPVSALTTGPTIGVEYLNSTDPVWVPKAAVSHVGSCYGHGYGRTCHGLVNGTVVLVAGVDYPKAK